MPAITLSIDSGTSFSTEDVINILDDAQNNAVSGDGSLVAVIDSATGELWLNYGHTTEVLPPPDGLDALGLPNALRLPGAYLTVSAPWLEGHA